MIPNKRIESYIEPPVDYMHQTNVKRDRLIVIEGFEPTNLNTPERRLCWAILRRALFDLTTPEERERDSAIEFFDLSRIDEEREWSFGWLCDLLNLCPYRVARAVKERLSRPGLL